MCCPKCGADTEVHIEATIPVKLLPHGEIDRVDDIEWQDTNPVWCGHCQFRGEVQDFRTDKDESGGL
jgi:hypothetical protein